MRGMQIIIAVLFVAAPAHAQQLQDYIEQAQANNPNIRAFELKHSIALEKVDEVDQLPNTEFGFGYFVSEPETRTGAQKARISAKQMLPWFGTITSNQEYAHSLAETEYIDYLIAKRKLALDVAKSYYELYGLQSIQLVLDQNIALLKSFEELALRSVEVDQASAVDVLRLQIRQNELQQEKEIIAEQFRGEQTKFNHLLNRDGLLAVTLPTSVEIPDEDPVTLDSLELNPELVKFDKLYQSVDQAELLNRKESAPMFGLGIDYIPVQERPDMNFSDNGKDIIMPMVSVSIPIFNKKHDSRTRQNELRKQQITHQRMDRLNNLESAKAKAIASRNQARIAFMTQKKNLEQARHAEQILIKNYETGTIDFEEVLDIQELQLKFQIRQIQSVQLYFVQSAIINYLVNK